MALRNFLITLRCENGHVQKMKYPAIDRENAEFFAYMLDGTSPAYKISPVNSPSSKIGKCATCSSQIEAKVEEIVK